MATDWSDEAKARRSASAKKAAETRKANRENPMRASMPKGVPEKNWGLKPMQVHSYYQNSRVARWALSGVSMLAITPRRAALRWVRTHNIPFTSNIDLRALRG